MSKTILVMGAAGYIGSHMVKLLLNSGFNVIAHDKDPALPVLSKATWCQGDMADVDQLREIFNKHSIDLVMHFSAFIEVGESVQKPAKYYDNNLAKTLVLLDVMREFNINKIVFSSTAAAFGEPQYVPIDEKHPIAPINPYGASKTMVERILADYDDAYGLKSIAFRYFNACGADPEGELGECHDPESHLIPLILQAANNRRDAIYVFGNDYDTPDGTCVRDYIHVTDLAQAHLLGVERLLANGESDRYNLGNGQGFSVQQVIDVARKVTGREIKQIDSERRAGDPARLVADSQKAVNELGWKPEYADLETIIDHAWKWELKRFG